MARHYNFPGQQFQGGDFVQLRDNPDVRGRIIEERCLQDGSGKVFDMSYLIRLEGADPYPVSMSYPQGVLEFVDEQMRLMASVQ